MRRVDRFFGAVAALLVLAGAHAEPPAPLIAPANRLAADAPAWRELAAKFAAQPDLTADFEERRTFPFRKEPVVLRGEVRVSRTRGLSLHYTQPEERIMVIDERGMALLGSPGLAAPNDPRAAAANEAMLLVLRFDFVALEKKFELYGRNEGEVWSLALVPRDATTRRIIGEVHVGGEGATVRRIELRRSAQQHIDILIDAPRSTSAFAAEELRRYFR